MECYTYLRNVTDILSDGKTPYERRFVLADILVVSSATILTAFLVIGLLLMNI